MNIFLISLGNRMLWILIKVSQYSLEVPQWGTAKMHVFVEK